MVIYGSQLLFYNLVLLAGDLFHLFRDLHDTL